jgi:very-short-patch-repair endonuclease
MSFKHPLPHAVRHAQDLRKRSTPAEVILWNVVRNRKFHGLKFRRQVPVGRFIVDFLCTHPALIIELDGPIHDFTINEDAERTEAITDDHNIPVLRVKNEEVLGHLPQVLKKMEQLLLSASSPSLLPMGGEGSTVMINRNFCSIIPRFPSLPQRERGGSAEPE